MGKKKKKVCGLCLFERVSSRLDQAHDSCSEMMASGTVQAVAASEMAIRLEESRFWRDQLSMLAHESGAKHRKSCLV